MLTESHPYPGKPIVVAGIDEIQGELRRHIAASLARSSAPAPHAVEASGPRSLPRR